MFFGRSNLRNAQPLGSSEDDPTIQRAQRRCCGMRRKWFILLCIFLLVIVTLTVLLPVFLIAVPREKASKSCAEVTPCRNGGVSVSSGSKCSCVCSNGYMGFQCTTTGDSSCTAADVDNGTVNKKATMGTSLPSLLEKSDEKFGIKLDAVTIMATFSLNNISCKTENALVSFDNLSRRSDKSRRSTAGPIVLQSMGDEDEAPSRPVRLSSPSPIIVPRSLASSNGIFYDDATGGYGSGLQADMAGAESTRNGAPAATATASEMGVQSTSSATARSSTATGIPNEVVEFSQVAVLFILQDTGSLNSAMYSGSQIEKYLQDSYVTATHPSLDLKGFDLDFENKTISRG